MGEEKKIIEKFRENLEKSGYASESAVKGCIVYGPDCLAVWENIKAFLDKKLEALGFVDMRFPMFIPMGLMRKEPEHYRVFSRELATVTRVGADMLDEELVISPTSETIIYEWFARKIKAEKDLPLKVNQYCSVVRWEKLKENQPLLRNNEFLWQESHSAHASNKEALVHVKEILGAYKELIENVLLLPAFVGFKPEHRKFPGAVKTFAIESLMPDCKAIQMATSHDLGQNFSKVFGIKFKNKGNKEELVWQACNGITTRGIGAMLLFHTDEKGFVVPPKVAALQVALLGKNLQKVEEKLKRRGIKAKVLGEASEEKLVLKGIPLIAKKKGNRFELLRRDSLEIIEISENKIAEKSAALLKDIQRNLANRRDAFVKQHSFETESREEFVDILVKHLGIVKAKWCGNIGCAKKIKEDTKGSLRVITEEAKNGKCVYCNEKAKFFAWFAEAY